MGLENISLGFSKPSKQKLKNKNKNNQNVESRKRIQIPIYNPQIFNRDYYIGFIYGIYFARVVLFNIKFLIRDNKQRSELLNECNKSIDHLDDQIEDMRIRLGIISPNDVTLDVILKEKTWNTNQLNLEI